MCSLVGWPGCSGLFAHGTQPGLLLKQELCRQIFCISTVFDEPTLSVLVAHSTLRSEEAGSLLLDLLVVA